MVCRKETNTMRHMRRIILGLLIMAAAVTGNFCIAMAAGPVRIMPWTQWVGDTEGWVHAPGGGYLDFICDPVEAMDGIRIVSVKSSNTKVLKVKKMGSKLSHGVRLIPGKKGKSKVTLTYKYDGRKYKATAVYAVKNPDIFNCIKVNGKKINLKKNKDNYLKTNFKKKKLTLKFSAKKGWKMDRFGSEVSFGDGNPPVKFKNGMTIKMPDHKIFINFMMKRGEYEWYYYSLGFTPDDMF